MNRWHVDGSLNICQQFNSSCVRSCTLDDAQLCPPKYLKKFFHVPQQVTVNHCKLVWIGVATIASCCIIFNWFLQIRVRTCFMGFDVALELHVMYIQALKLVRKGQAMSSCYMFPTRTSCDFKVRPRGQVTLLQSWKNALYPVASNPDH